MTTSSIRVRVTSKADEALNICRYELVSANGSTLPPFSAGSHIDVTAPNGLTRQYSLCSGPADSHHYLIGVLKDAASRGGSQAMHELVQEGTELIISPPRNHFALAHPPQKSLLMAGGIGITPILCMAERLAVLGEPFEMHYCARSEASMAFRQRIAGSAFAPCVHFHFDDGAAEQKLDMAAVLGSPRPDTHLYVCGPKGFMDAVLNTARAAGWPAERLHYEFFSSEVAKSADDGSFEVKLASTGRVVFVPRDKSVIEALAAAGIEVPFSCEQGVCGTCLTRVLEGECDHRDMFLAKDEQARNDQFTPCRSRAKSAMLVLDL